MSGYAVPAGATGYWGIPSVQAAPAASAASAAAAAHASHASHAAFGPSAFHGLPGVSGAPGAQVYSPFAPYFAPPGYPPFPAPAAFPSFPALFAYPGFPGFHAFPAAPASPADPPGDARAESRGPAPEDSTEAASEAARAAYFASDSSPEPLPSAGVAFRCLLAADLPLPCLLSLQPGEQALCVSTSAGLGTVPAAEVRGLACWEIIPARDCPGVVQAALREARVGLFSEASSSRDEWFAAELTLGPRGLAGPFVDGLRAALASSGSLVVMFPSPHSRAHFLRVLRALGPADAGSPSPGAASTDQDPLTLRLNRAFFLPSTQTTAVTSFALDGAASGAAGSPAQHSPPAPRPSLPGAGPRSSLLRSEGHPSARASSGVKVGPSGFPPSEFPSELPPDDSLFVAPQPRPDSAVQARALVDLVARYERALDTQRRIIDGLWELLRKTNTRYADLYVDGRPAGEDRSSKLDRSFLSQSRAWASGLEGKQERRGAGSVESAGSGLCEGREGREGSEVEPGSWERRQECDGEAGGVAGGVGVAGAAGAAVALAARSPLREAEISVNGGITEPADAAAASVAPAAAELGQQGDNRLLSPIADDPAQVQRREADVGHGELVVEAGPGGEQ